MLKNINLLQKRSTLFQYRKHRLYFAKNIDAIQTKDNSDLNTGVSVCVCAYFLRVFMAGARSPAGRVLGPRGRATTPATSEGTSSALLSRKPGFVKRNKRTVKTKMIEGEKNVQDKSQFYQTAKGENSI